MFIITICLFFFSCNNELIKKWRKFNSYPPKIKLDKRGENGVRGNYLIENSYNLNSAFRKDEYFLKNAKGQTHKLNIELTWREYQILYFEFTQNSLFIIINSFRPDDWITIKKFSLEDGELIFEDRGVIPCEENKTKKFEITQPWNRQNDWSLGNRKCNWINFRSHQISYLKSSFVKAFEVDSLYEFNIFSYNWLENKLDTLPRNFSVGIDAFSGRYTGLRDIQYNEGRRQFEY